jgi:hypothetical protein
LVLKKQSKNSKGQPNKKQGDAVKPIDLKVLSALTGGLKMLHD